MAELFLDIPAEPEFDIAFTDPLTPSIEISADIVTSGGDIDIQAGSGTAWVNAVLNASNLDDGAIGGSVSVLGDYVNLGSDAVIDVTGDAGGGVVLVGGDFQGGGDTPTAKKTTIAAGAQIRADAVTDGDGGKIIVWADDRTEFSGDISVTGGELGGDGGFVEVSGKKSLKYRGHVDASAPNGEYGDLLLDPQNIFIVNGVGGTGSIAGGNNGGTSNETNYTIYEDTLEAQTANVTLLAGDLIQLNNLSDDLLDMQANLSLLIGGDGSDGGIIRFGTAGAASSTINDVIRVNNDSANITIGARDSAAGPVAIRVGRLEALDVDTGDSQSKASIDIRSNGGDITIYGGMLASANVDSGVKAEAHITVSAATPSTNSTVKDGNVTITGELRAVASDASHTADADITVNNAHDVTLDSAVVLAQVTTTYAGKTADANLVLHAGSDAGRGSSGKLVVNENISVTASNEQYGGVASASADLRAAADIYLNVGDASDKTEAAVEVLAITKSTLNTLNNAANDKADAELYIYAGSHSSGGLTVYGGLVVNAEVDNKNENDTAPVMRADATLRVLAADNITVKTDAFQTANAFEVVAKNVSKGDKSKTAEKANAYLYVQAGLPDHVNASSASGGNLTVIGQTVVKATASGSDFAGDANAQAYLLAYDDVSLTHDGSNTSYLGIEISAKSDFAGDGTSANLGDTKAYLYIHAGEEGASPNTAKSSDGIVTISDDIQVTAVSQKLAGDADADIIIKAADSITVTGEVGAKASVVASANDIAENSDLGNYLYEGSANAFVRIEAGTHNSDGSISIKKITVDADIKQGTNANAYTDPWTANLNARATLKIFGGDDVTIGSSGMFSSNVINVDAFASDSGSNPFSDLDINTFATAVVYAGSHSDGDLTITGQTRTVAETRVHDGAAYEGDAQAYADLRLLAADDVTISGDEAITVYAGMLSAESGRSSDTVDGTADAYLYILAGDPDHVSTADEANSTFYAGDLSVTGKTSVKALVSDHGGGSGFGDKAQARAFFEAGDDVTLSILDGNSDTAIEVIARADVQDIGKSTSADVDAYLYIHAGLESGTKGSDGKISIRGDVDVDAWGFGIAGRADADAYLIAAGDISIEYLGDAKIHVDALSSVASESTLGTANKTRTAVADAYLYVNAGTHTANSSGVVTIEAIEVDAQAITDSLGVLYNGLSRLALDADATLIINAGDDINLGFAYAGTASAGLLETAVSVQASATHDYSVTEHVGQVDLDARIVIDITAGTHSSGDLNIKGKLFADADVTLGSAMISTGGSGKADAEVDVRLSAADDINLTRKIGHDAIEIEAHADIADSNARGTAEAYLYVLAGDPDHIGSDAAEPGDINVVGEIDVRSIAALHENPTDSTGSGFYEPEASSYFGYATRADAEVHLLAGGDITVTDSGRNVRVEAYTLNTGSNASYAGSANAYLYVQAGWQGDSSQNTKGINGSITIGSSGGADVDVKALAFGHANKADAEAIFMAANNISVSSSDDGDINVIAQAVNTHSAAGDGKNFKLTADANLHIEAGTQNSSGSVYIEDIDVYALADIHSINPNPGAGDYNGVASANATLHLTAGGDIQLNHSGSDDTSAVEVRAVAFNHATNTTTASNQQKRAEVHAVADTYIYAGSHSSGELVVYGSIITSAYANAHENVANLSGSGTATAKTIIGAADDITIKFDSAATGSAAALVTAAYADLGDSDLTGTADAYLYVLAGDPDHIGSDSVEPGDLDITGRVIVEALNIHSDSASTLVPGYAGVARAEAHLLAGDDVRISVPSAASSLGSFGIGLGLFSFGTACGCGSGSEAVVVNAAVNPASSVEATADAYLYIHAGEVGAPKGSDGVIDIAGSIVVNAAASASNFDAAKMNAEVYLEAADDLTIDGQVSVVAGAYQASSGLDKRIDLQADAYFYAAAGTHDSDGSLTIDSVFVLASAANSDTSSGSGTGHATARTHIQAADNIQLGSTAAALSGSPVITTVAILGQTMTPALTDKYSATANLFVYAGSHSSGDLHIDGDTYVYANANGLAASEVSADAQLYFQAADHVDIDGDLQVVAGAESRSSGTANALAKISVLAATHGDGSDRIGDIVIDGFVRNSAAALSSSNANASALIFMDAGFSHSAGAHKIAITSPIPGSVAAISNKAFAVGSASGFSSAKADTLLRTQNVELVGDQITAAGTFIGDAIESILASCDGSGNCVDLSTKSGGRFEARFSIKTEHDDPADVVTTEEAIATPGLVVSNPQPLPPGVTTDTELLFRTVVSWIRSLQEYPNILSELSPGIRQGFEIRNDGSVIFSGSFGNWFRQAYVHGLCDYIDCGDESTVEGLLKETEFEQSVEIDAKKDTTSDGISDTSLNRLELPEKETG
ncbi:MAG: hypothetical protein ACI9FD_001498 [Gammaproteobacteria bacterium]